MKAKKERERQALEEAGNYKEALEMLQQERDEHMKQAEAFTQMQQDWEMQRRRFAVMTELQKPGVINATVPPGDIMHFVELDKVELDETGKVIDWQTHYQKLIDGRDYLKPTGVGKTISGIAPPPAGAQGTTANSKAAMLVHKHTGINLEQCNRLVENKQFMETAERSGWLDEPKEYGKYSPTGVT